MPQGYQPAPLQDTAPTSLHDAAAKRWLRAVAEVVNRTVNGKINVTLSVTLVQGASTTTIYDARVSAFSALSWNPTTLHAAAEIAAGGFYVSSQQNGQFTLTHANNAIRDRTFTFAILG